MTPEGNASLYVERQMTAPDVIDLGDARAAVFAGSPAYDNRTNQDSAAVVSIGPGQTIIAVADGAGGLPAGHKASALAVMSIVEAVKAGLTDGRSLRGAVIDGFDAANRAILELGVGAATTLVVLQIEDGTLRPYHVGDSSVLVFGQRGKVKLQTMSHSPVGYQVEAGVLKPEEALHHEDLNVVSNLVGSNDMRIEVGAPIALARYDTVIVGSDGLFDNLHAREIIAIARKGPVEKAAKTLFERSRKRMIEPSEGAPSKPDDLTFAVYRGHGRKTKPKAKAKTT